MGDLLLIGSSAPRAPRPDTWVGRTVMLNISVAPRFQTKGLALNGKASIMVVPPDIIEEQIQRAIDNGTLIDITEAGTKNIKLRGSELSPVKEAESRKVAFFTGRDASGNVYFITPKDEEDHQRMLEEIRTTGGLRVPKSTMSDTSASFEVFHEPIAQIES